GDVGAGGVRQAVPGAAGVAGGQGAPPAVLHRPQRRFRSDGVLALMILGSGRRLRGTLAGTATLALAGGVLVLGIHGGYPAARPQLLSGSAWLASPQVGQLTLLDGASAEVAAQVRVAQPGEHLDAVQQAGTGYAVNRSTGTVRRVDGGTFEVTPPASPLPEAREGLRAFAGTDALYTLDSQRGVIIAADPTTLAA